MTSRWMKHSAAALVVVALGAAMLLRVDKQPERHAPEPPMSVASRRTAVVDRPAEALTQAEAMHWYRLWPSPAQRMVISTADLTVKVRNVPQAIEEMTSAVRQAGGYISESSESRHSSKGSGRITVRAPVKAYGRILEGIGRLGKIVSKDERCEDVTEEYVDIQSRLRNLSHEEEAFLRVLHQARKVTDILAVERELSRVRGEIEAVTGRIKYLQNQISLATINVSFYATSTPVRPGWPVSWNFASPAANAVHALGLVVHKLVTAGIWLAVFSPLWGGAALGVRGAWRSRRGAAAQV
ncbi:MAG: DUF4349 domain-containing protein [Armatimonadetes bacterium]|nr:DUF4349 domain-containing protein [Armatimonadota bacterium]